MSLNNYFLPHILFIKLFNVKYRKILLVYCICLLALIASCSKPLAVENMGIFTPSRINDVAGQDGFSSIPLNESVMMWTFGDTILGKWDSPPSVSTTFEESARFREMIPNSLAFSDIPTDANITDLAFHYYRNKNKVTTFISYNKNENPMKIRFWALDGIKINDSVYVYYVKIVIKNRTSPELFTVSGTGLAQWKQPVNWKIGEAVNFKRLGILFNGNYPVFGDSVISLNGWLYILGHKKTGPESVSAFIARVKTHEVTKSDCYEYLNAEGTWSGNIRDAIQLFQDVAGEPSLSFNKKLGSFVIIYCSFDGSIKALTFNNFEKLVPCSAETIYRPPLLQPIPQRPLLFYYSGKEIVATENALYAIYINPAIYQPILIKIPYPVLSN
ncbi:MAG TPA: DUF4185 domain-containing protein [Spirochaetota bacterium]|nr:DUF4185 domain-containing protein [Spirochaetota bacterium]HPR47797.1 DUF4185 domain-containing protein [Spirochaetota bacterium]